MAYTRVNWQNSPSHATPLSAENLNVMDEGIYDLDTTVTEATGDIADLKEDLADETTARENADSKMASEISDLFEMATPSAYNNDKVPYFFRASGGGKYIGGIEKDTIVGGTVAWNQLANVQSNGTVYGITRTRVDNKTGLKYTGTSEYTTNYTCGSVNTSHYTPNHKWFVTLGINTDLPSGIRLSLSPNSAKPYVITNVSTTTPLSFGLIINNETTIDLTVYPQAIDLTQMFGSTIADYIYSLEQATAGSGVAKLKSWGFFNKDYYAYDAGSLKSVEGLEAHVMEDAEENIIGNYPLDSDLTLRGIPKLDSGNNLYYDGDVYASDGSVTRKYALNQMTYTYLSGLSDAYIGYYEHPTYGNTIWVRNWNYQTAAGRRAGGIGAVCNAFKVHMHDSDIQASQYRTYFEVGSITSVSDFLTKVQSLDTGGSGLYLVYELATPTTETADPYQNPQLVDKDGTEEYVTTGIVPVGHDTDYYLDADSVLTPPSTAGTYSLKVTVASNGSKSYSWVSD